MAPIWVEPGPLTDACLIFDIFCQGRESVVHFSKQTKANVMVFVIPGEL